MDVYITFYSKFPKNRIYIYNGFSFGRDKQKEDVDLFISDSFTSEEIHNEIEKYKPERIWCSISLFSQYEQIKSIANDKWIVGGPLTKKRFFSENNFKFKVVTDTFESFLGKEGLSSEYDFYLSDFIKNFNDSKITYNCSIGYGCYWGKCSFCSYRKFSCSSGVILRDVDKLFDKIPPFIDKNNNRLIVHTCIDSLPHYVLERVLSGYYKVDSMTSFVRADKKTLEIFKMYPRDLKYFTFSVGIEGFSQEILDKVNKGILLEDVIDLVKYLLEKGATVYLSSLGGYPFLTKEIVEDSIKNIRILREFQKLEGKLFMIYNSKIFWPSEDIISGYGFPVRKDDLDGFVVEIPENSEQYVYNKEIEKEIFNSFERLIAF